MKKKVQLYKNVKENKVRELLNLPMELQNGAHRENKYIYLNGFVSQLFVCADFREKKLR